MDLSVPLTPDSLTEIQQLVVTRFFQPEDLKDPNVLKLITGTMGEALIVWAKASVRGILPDQTPSDVKVLCQGKLALLQKYYPHLELLDVLVLYAYSWRADRFMREAMQQNGWKNFGCWQTFANFYINALRKLVRFTSPVLYRCSLGGEQGESSKLLRDGSWVAHSFLSTTYDVEAKADLEKGKYQYGQTLVIDASQVESYHIEDFSLFSGECEVVVLPDYTLKVRDVNGRNIQVTATPGSLSQFTPRTGHEPDSVAYFQKLRQEALKNVPPPPKGPFK
jgi:hypothetical protein